MTVARLRDEMSAEEYLLWHEHFRLEKKRADEERRRRG
jgi:hypothetical protein